MKIQEMRNLVAHEAAQINVYNPELSQRLLRSDDAAYERRSDLQRIVSRIRQFMRRD